MNDYQWKGPLLVAIADQARDALIDPELLQYATQTPHGADGRIQDTGYHRPRPPGAASPSRGKQSS